MVDETVPSPVELAKSEPDELKRTGPPPDGVDPLSRVQAMRILGVGANKFAELVRTGELRSWQVGKEVFVDRAEIEALSEIGGGQATLQRTYVALVKQAQDHQERTMKLLEGGLEVLTRTAREFAGQSAEVVKSLIERERNLQEKLSALQQKAVEVEVHEAEQTLQLVERTVAAESRMAMIDAAKQGLPILLASWGARSPDASTRDRSLADGVRAIARNTELVAKITGALPDDQAGLVAALVDAAKEPEPPGKAS